MSHSDLCSICYDATIDYTTNCNHDFCNKCITNWLLSNNNCPLCRKEFYDIEDSDDDSDNEDVHSVTFLVLVRSRSNITIWLLEDFLNYLMNRRYVPKADFHYYSKLPKNVNYNFHNKRYRFDNTNYIHKKKRY
jgi:hypothetical protein